MSHNAQPLSSSEKVLLQELLSRATACAEMEEPSTPGSFSVIESSEQGGGMSDAAKRLNPVDEELMSSKRPYCLNSGTGESSGAPSLLGRTPQGKPIFLPAGVNDMESWGRSVIQFGKYMSKKGTAPMSYAELFAARVSDDEKRRYVRWVVAQVDSAKGHLLDLGMYLCIRTDEGYQNSQLPLIPGTGVVRLFK